MLDPRPPETWYPTWPLSRRSRHTPTARLGYAVALGLRRHAPRTIFSFTPFAFIYLMLNTSSAIALIYWCLIYVATSMVLLFSISLVYTFTTWRWANVNSKLSCQVLTSCTNLARESSKEYLPAYIVYLITGVRSTQQDKKKSSAWLSRLHNV